MASATPNGTVSGVSTPTSAFGRGAKAGSGIERAGSAAMIVSGVCAGSSGAASATIGMSARWAWSGGTMAIAGAVALATAVGLTTFLGAGAALSVSASSSASSAPPPNRAASRLVDFLPLPPALASSILGVPLDLRDL